MRRHSRRMDGQGEKKESWPWQPGPSTHPVPLGRQGQDREHGAGLPDATETGPGLDLVVQAAAVEVHGPAEPIAGLAQAATPLPAAGLAGRVVLADQARPVSGLVGDLGVAGEGHRCAGQEQGQQGHDDQQFGRA
jgi:hypothetical protein